MKRERIIIIIFLITIGSLFISLGAIKQSLEIQGLRNEINDIKTEIEFRDYIKSSNINKD